MKKIKKISIVAVLAIALVLGFTGPSLIQAATTPTLGTASTFGVLSSTFTNSNTSPYTIVTGDIGYTVAGAPVTAPITVTGTLHPEDATFTSAGTAQNNALSNLNSQSCTTITGPLDAIIIGTNAPGVFPPGCYTMATDLIITLNTSITLDLTATGAVGNTWIFKSTGGGLTTGADSFVTLAHGASACNVFWAPVAATNIGAYTGALPNTTKLFIGTIIDAAGINLGHFANLSGQALAFGGTVTTDANTITVPSCAAPSTITVTKIVTNDNNGTKGVLDFPLFVDSTSVVSGVANTFAIGTYTITETTDSQYEQTFSGACNADGVVTLGAGENLTCTITNNDIAPRRSGSSGSYVAPRILPLIGVVKTANVQTLTKVPGVVTYDYTVWNQGGKQALVDVTLTDDKCTSVTFISGDINNDKKLDITESWKYNCLATISTTTTNTALATGYGDDSYHLITTANAYATVYVSIPAVVKITPRLPKTGFPDQNTGTPWYMNIFFGIFN